MSKPKRMTMELNDVADEEWGRMKRETGANPETLLKAMFTLLRMYVDAKKDGMEFRVVKISDPSEQYRITIPIE